MGIGAKMISERLNKAQTKQQEITTQLNQLEQQKQLLLQEFLRLEGAIRELTLMRDEENVCSNDKESG